MRQQLHVTIRAVGPHDPIRNIVDLAREHSNLRLEAAITAGAATWSREQRTEAHRRQPSFERLREMVAEYRGLYLPVAIHLQDCYAEMAKSGNHEHIVKLAQGADRIQVDTSTYDYEAIEDLQRSLQKPTIVRTWAGFPTPAPRTKLEYLYIDRKPATEAWREYPRPWPGVRCGYAGVNPNAHTANAVRSMLAAGNTRGWIEIDLTAAAADTPSRLDLDTLGTVLAEIATTLNTL